MGGAIKHPEEGKVVNMNESVRKETGVEDAKLTIYPVNGYGSPELLRNIMAKKNQMLFFTIQTQDFGVGCMKWNTRLDRRCLFFIITYGMIGQLQNTMRISMSVLI